MAIWRECRSCSMRSRRRGWSGFFSNSADIGHDSAAPRMKNVSLKAEGRLLRTSCRSDNGRCRASHDRDAVAENTASLLDSRPVVFESETDWSDVGMILLALVRMVCSMRCQRGQIRIMLNSPEAEPGSPFDSPSPPPKRARTPALDGANDVRPNTDLRSPA